MKSEPHALATRARVRKSSLRPFDAAGALFHGVICHSFECKHGRRIIPHLGITLAARSSPAIRCSSLGPLRSVKHWLMVLSVGA